MVGVSSSIILLSFLLMFTYLFVMWNGEIHGSQDDICCVYLFFMNIMLIMLTFIQIIYREDAERDTSFFTRSPKRQTEFAVWQIKW